MRVSTPVLLLLFSQVSAAEVFKCVGKYGAVSYQTSPCASAIKQQEMNIVSDPAKEAAAKARLEEVRSEDESRKAAKREAAKEAFERNVKAATADAALRNAAAQQEQADAQRGQATAQQRQAAALERQQDRPLVIAPGGIRR